MKEEHRQDLEALLERLREQPDDAAAHRRAGGLLGKEGRFSEALSHLEQAVRADPTHGRTWYFLGRAASRTGDLEAGRRAAERLQQFAPDDGLRLADRADLLHVLGHATAALERAQQRTRLEPESGQAWYAVAVAASGAGDWWTAREALETSIHLSHATAGTRGDLAWVLYQMDEPRQAITQLEGALPLTDEPSLKSVLLECLGYVYKRLNDRDRTLHFYRAAVEADVTNAKAQQGLGASYSDLKQYDAALPHLEEAARLAPDDPHAHYALGRVSAWVGRLPRAQEAFERAIALDFPDGRARAQLAWVHEQQGRMAEAADQAKRALKKGVPKKWRAWVHGMTNSRKAGR